MHEYKIVAQRFTRNGSWRGSRQVPTFYVMASSPLFALAEAQDVLGFTSDEDGSISVIEREPR